ncbi:MAG TPA: L-histidine N(alpha)-methyltransferase [Lacipirellula sp.]
MSTTISGNSTTFSPACVRSEAAERSSFVEDLLRGLSQTSKRIDCKYFYDKRGSELFDQICELPEYYPTRPELSIMRRDGEEMAAAIGERCLLVEYGSGSSLKTRLLLNRLQAPAGYVPIDISRQHLLAASGRIRTEYPSLSVVPLCADYTRSVTLPRLPGAERTVAFFPGSTISNFEPEDAAGFLRSIRTTCGPGGGLLIGVDLKKDPALLHAAYNDAAGVTARFNLNVLARANREVGANFDLGGFAHYAFYNAAVGRIEMHLVSRRDQTVLVADRPLRFREGESLLTEYSYKYTTHQFANLARQAGYQVKHAWIDQRRLFSVQYLAE